jgi:phosphorylase kinase alpha/beta subunit
VRNAADTIHNERLRPLVKHRYDEASLADLDRFFRAHHTLEIEPYSNGLCPASPGGGESKVSGYHHVWVRDNVFVANAKRELGDVPAAIRTVTTMLEYFRKHGHRFADILEGHADPADPTVRPNVRFDGATLDEIDAPWPHAQNDALGYFLWLCFTLANQHGWTPSATDLEVLAGFPLLFRALEYWQDEDSGHWEEGRAVRSSSVGAVVAGLEQMRRYFTALELASAGSPVSPVQRSLLDDLIARGRDTMDQQLPLEAPPRRAADAATIFLIEPLAVVDDTQADAILKLVRDELEGDFGIKRYVGDSYWCADFREHLPPERRSGDFSQSIEERDGFLVPGTEAQWCIFDPMISAAYGRRYLRTGRAEDLELQVGHFNRALGQITGEESRFDPGVCPEAYFVESSQEGVYRPNDQTPLAWTQANLAVAFEMLRRSVAAGR